MSKSDSILFNVDINNYNGPLDILLDLAKAQKVDLEEISITKLADQFHEFIKSTKNINLEVQDNGCGITVDQIQNLRSLGLLGMRERAMVWGGYVNIERVTEGGTIVTINIKKDENGENEGEN